MSENELINNLMHTSAENAVRYIKAEYQINLDYSEYSLKDIDFVLDKISENGPFYINKTDQDILDNLWIICEKIGGYIGEIIKNHIGGEWKTRSIEWNNKRNVLYTPKMLLNPVKKVFYRLTQNVCSNIYLYYHTVKYINSEKDLFNISVSISLYHLMNDRSIDSDLRCIVYKNKSYATDDNHFIQVDIAIEVYSNDSAEIKILWIIECLNDNKIEVEEFHKKIKEISFRPINSVIVTEVALKEKDFNYAESQGMAVVRILPGRQVRNILYKSTPEERNWMWIVQNNGTREAIASDTFIAGNRNFFGCYKNDFMIHGLHCF